jgi:hypothetical protein
MLESRAVEPSAEFQIGATLRFRDRRRLLFVELSSVGSKLFRMIFLCSYNTELLWNDIVARKQGVGWAPQLKL